MNSIAIQELDHKEAIYSSDELSLISAGKLPHHIAIIPDGNRRWARRRGLPLIGGHWKGVEAITNVIRAASALGIKVLTVYAFSSENWSRSKAEVDALMQLYSAYLMQQRDQMIAEGVKLDTIGDLSRLPVEVRDALEETRMATRHCSRIELVLAFNYGGRDDIRRAALAILNDYSQGKLKAGDLSEKMFSSYLDTAKWEDPELLIRTSGEQRLSNFLLWQISYTEVYITDVLWPDFNERDLLDAVLEYQQRERRLGGS